MKYAQYKERIQAILAGFLDINRRYKYPEISKSEFEISGNQHYKSRHYSANHGL